MTSKSEVHNNVYKSELNQLEAEYEEIYSRCKQEKSKRKKEELTRKCNELKALHDKLRKDSRLKEYKRKSDSLAERVSSGAFWMKEGKNAKNIYFTNEQTCIYFVLIRLASMHNSCVSVWCNEGIDKFDSAMRVELYEYIKENIYMAAGIETWGKAPYIDQWLQVLDVEIDYTMSKRVCIIKELLEKMRMEGLAINHQINYGSIVCQDGDSMYYAKYPYGPVASSVPKDVNPFEYDKFGNEEQFLAGIENLSRQYLESIKQKSSDMLKWGIGFGKNVKELNDCVENGEENQSEDIEDFNYDFPEYEQRNKNLIRYAKSGIETVKKTLEELNISEEEAISYLEYL